MTTDIRLNGSDDAPCAVIPGWHGFAVCSSATTLSALTRGCPLVDEVSTFWFAALMDVTNGACAQVTVMNFTSEDSVMAFTWQNVSVGQVELDSGAK
jgi:hypothetical protein